MIQEYKELLNMKEIASLEKDISKLEEIRKIQYQDKNFITDKLIAYLKKELNIEYFKYKVKDIHGNIADILVKKDSNIFKENIKEKDFVNFNVEELIDSRMFNNKNEIIIIDLNTEANLLDIEYLCESLEYNYLSYSNEIIDRLSIFASYVINWYKQKL